MCSYNSSHLVKYFSSKDDASKFTHASSKIVKLACPDCGLKKETRVTNLTRSGFFCPICNDGVSYPEKFISNLFKMVNVDFIFQLGSGTFKWCEKYKYDFFIPSLNLICETHGHQHYGGTKWQKTYSEEQENDKQKKNLARKNSVKYYITLDCRLSTLNHVKQSVMNSELPKLLNFKEEDIDWTECDKKSNNSLFLDVIEVWNESDEKIKINVIAKQFKLHPSTIRRYLIKGNDVGICKYKE